MAEVRALAARPEVVALRRWGLTEVLDLRVALLVAGLGSAVSVLYAWLSPLRTAQAAAAGPGVSSRAAPGSG